MSSRFFVNGFNDYDYDRFQNLDLRFVLGGGLGYMAWKGERGRLDILGGGAYNREKFSPVAPDPPFSRNSGEAYFGDDFTYKLNTMTEVHPQIKAAADETRKASEKLKSGAAKPPAPASAAPPQVEIKK